jgi:hypothetical protein
MRLRHHNRRLAPCGLRSDVPPHMAPARLLQMTNSVSSGTRGTGCVPRASLSPWECRTAQSRRATSEEATWGLARGEASDHAQVAGSGRGCGIPVVCGLAIAASKMRGESFGSAAMPLGGAMIKHGRFCGSVPGCGTSRTMTGCGSLAGLWDEPTNAQQHFLYIYSLDIYILAIYFLITKIRQGS